MIHSQVFPKSCQLNNPSAEGIAQKHKPHPHLVVTMLSVSRFYFLFLFTGMGVATQALLGIYLDTAIAQTPKTPKQMHLSERTISQVNMLFVNPSVGDDKEGNGGESTPLKTITQALQVAQPNTVIMLTKGTYSAQTGEKFPLILKPGISIQGDVSSKGRDIIITGGGEYLSRSFGSKNVAIVGGKGTQLTGVTVTNSSPRGYGLWIESSSLLVADNTFTGSTQDGVTVTGNGAPKIRNNLFYRNGANGITITGTARPEIRENVFQETGFGINVAEKAEPVVMGNQIQNNRSGIIIQASSRPVLRNNLIEGNKEDGIVAIAQAQPDLGNASEPGGNEFRSNARYDINANAAKQTIAAYGNTLAGRNAGKVDTSNTAAPIARDSQSSTLANNTSQETQTSQEITFSAPRVSPTTNRRIAPILRNSTSGSSNNTVSRPLNNRLLPLQPANSKLGVTATKPKQPTSRRDRTGFPIPSSLAPRQTTTGWQQTRTSATPQLNYTQIDQNTVEFVAPQSSAPTPEVINRVPKSGSTTQSLPTLPTLQPAPIGESGLLPPGGNVPLRSTENMQKAPLPENSTTTAFATGTAGQPQSMRYRVMAEVQNQRDQELVRFLAPGAFPTYWQGRAAMQAGVFSSRNNAEQMITILNNNGLRGAIEQVGQ